MCRFLTSIVVTISVLLASVSDALRSRDVEFMANVLLEYQVPICPSGRKRRTKRRGGWRKEEERGVKIQISRPKSKNEKVPLYFRDYFNCIAPNWWPTSAEEEVVWHCGATNHLKVESQSFFFNTPRNKSWLNTWTHLSVEPAGLWFRLQTSWYVAALLKQTWRRTMKKSRRRSITQMQSQI